MWKVNKFITFLPTLLIVLLSFFVAISQANASESQQTGSITICKAISDQNGNVIDGSQAPGATFTISGFVPNPVPIDGGPAGALPTSSFTTPLTLNTKVFTESPGNDSQCVTYSNLSFGAYYYGQETIPASGWQTPLYNDQFTSVVSKVSDVFPYDARLFSANQSDVDQRNENADGSIVLNEEKPNRTLVVVNTLASTPNNPPKNNGGGNNGGGGNGGSGNPGAPVCNDTVPSSAPAITNVSLGQNSVTLTWTKASDPVSYYLVAYGTQPGNYQFGNPNVGNVTSYTINGLSGGQIYYFAVKAVHGCKPGPFSNEVSSNPTGGEVAGVADEFVPGVLAATTSAATDSADPISITKSVCQACLWWPMLLGEILVLVAWYLWARKKGYKTSRILVAGAIGIVTYVIFLFVNKGHVCPDGTISLWIFSIPCKYFWAVDGIFVVIFGLFIRKINVSTKETPKKSK